MISYAKALDILRQAAPLPTIDLPVIDSAGHVALSDIHSPLAVPSFANSAMDGFAVRSKDCAKLPANLAVTGQSVAGDSPSDGKNAAWEIMTGAPVPPAYDTVIKIEDVEIVSRNPDNNPTQIRLSQPVNHGGNIRLAGQDFKIGDKLIDAGALITPQHIMALAATGIQNINVSAKPRVTVFSTGKEIIDDPEHALKPGQIYNSNTPYLISALSDLNTVPAYGGLIRDLPNVFEDKVKKAIPKSDLIISTGAVSAGRFDFVPESLTKLGAKILFHKVAIRPGKPILYAKLPNGVHYLGLPGNPVSAAVGLRFFGVPLLRAMTGQPNEAGLMATVSKPYSKPHTLRFFGKARAQFTRAELSAHILTGQESFKIHPMLEMNCWAVVSEDTHDLKPADDILIYPLKPDGWSLA
jgi:molybdopterin molybdotransferase